MAGISDKHKETYRQEAYELLGELEEALLELEARTDDMELVGRVFRAMHTIKGSGAMFGFDDIASFTHEVETVFDLVRNGNLQVTKDLINLTLNARDYIREMLDSSISGASIDYSCGSSIVQSLKKLTGSEETETETETQENKQEPQAQGAETTYRINFRPDKDIFLKGSNPIYLLDDLRRLGPCNAIAQIKDIPQIEDMDPEMCYTYWDILLTTSAGINAIRDVFIFVEDESQIKIDVIDEGSAADEFADYKRLGEILIERGDISSVELGNALKDKKKLGETLVQKGIVEEQQVEAALQEQKRIQEIRRDRLAKDAASTIRVSSDKLDSLVDLVGEMVTVQAHLTQVSGRLSDAELSAISEEIERLTAELHDNAMSMRMLPMGSTYSKFRRLVRDLSAELGREVNLTTDGAETELDKTVIEKLNDPLVHIIRNSLDHGIEPPEDRKAAGKPRQGTIHLSAMHSGANVLIRIKDDGKGLNAGAIKAKAVEKGLVLPDTELSDKEIYSLIFLPGFSTASKVTGVSGRGVGMDVVKKSIESLRGSIDIDSAVGRGTTITLKIPLTLAIIQGLLVTIGNGYYVFPLLSVEECVELTERDIQRAHGRHIINVRGEIVPYIRLREAFYIEGASPGIEQVVLVRSEGQRVGFVVDSVIGEHQTVIKTLGRTYSGVKGISGATILGDGTVALILDVPKLIENEEVEEAYTSDDKA